MDKLIETIKAQGYKPIFEIAVYNDDHSVHQCYEYDVEDIDDFLWEIGYNILKTDYTYFEISLYGQTEDGCNEITYNLRDVNVKIWG